MPEEGEVWPPRGPATGMGMGGVGVRWLVAWWPYCPRACFWVMSCGLLESTALLGMFCFAPKGGDLKTHVAFCFEKPRNVVEVHCNPLRGISQPQKFHVSPSVLWSTLAAVYDTYIDKAMFRGLAQAL